MSMEKKMMYKLFMSQSLYIEINASACYEKCSRIGLCHNLSPEDGELIHAFQKIKSFQNKTKCVKK